MKYLPITLFFFLFYLVECQSQDLVRKQAVASTMTSVENGLPSSTITAMLLDQLGFLLIKTPDLYQFDGANFVKYPSELIPHVHQYNIQACSDGSFIFYNDSLILRVVQIEGEFNIVSKKLLDQPVDNYQIIHVDSTQIIIKSNKINLTVPWGTKKPTTSLATFQVHGFRYNPILIKNAGHVIGQNKETKKKFIYKFNENGKIDRLSPEMKIITIKQIDEKSGYLFSTDSLFWYDFQKNKIVPLIKYPHGIQITDRILNNCNLAVINKNTSAVSLNVRLFQYDQSENKWLFEYVNESGETLVKNGGSISEIVIDKFKNIYVRYLFKGILRIQSPTSTVQYYGNKKEQDNFTKDVLVDESSNRVFQVTTSSGIRVFDLKGNIVLEKKEFRPMAGKMITTFIVKKGKDDYLLLNQDRQTEKYNYFITLMKYDSLGSSHFSFKDFTIEQGAYHSSLVFENDSIIQQFLRHYVLTFHKKKPFELPHVKTLRNIETFSICKISDNYWQLSDGQINISNHKAQALNTIKLEQLGALRCQLKVNDSTLIVGADKGIVSIDIHSKKATRWDKIFDCIYAIVPYKNDLWCSTNNGIIQIRDSNVIRRLGAENGIQGNEFNTNSFDTGISGRIYFGGVNGISAFHPDSFKRTNNVVNTIVQNISVNNIRNVFITPENKNAITLQPNEHSISFLPRTLGRLPSSVYNNQYAIPGQTLGWIDAKKNSYINLSLSPGGYTIYYASSNFFNPDAPFVKSFEVVALAHWYQSRIFYIALAMLLSGFLVYIFTLKRKHQLKDKIKALTVKENVQKERDRISRELHDNIGVQLGILGRSLDWVVDNMESQSDKTIKEKLLNLSDVSDEANENLRDTIWASKKEMYSVQDVISRISLFVHKIRTITPDLTFHLDFSNIEHTLRPSAALNLYRITQEAIHNTIKHGQAKNVWINCTKSNFEIIFELKDDGCGFDRDKNSEGNGLLNMTKRAKEAGFEIEIKSEINLGTQVIITLKT